MYTQLHCPHNVILPHWIWLKYSYPDSSSYKRLCMSQQSSETVETGEATGAETGSLENQDLEDRAQLEIDRRVCEYSCFPMSEHHWDEWDTRMRTQTRLTEMRCTCWVPVFSYYRYKLTSLKLDIYSVTHRVLQRFQDWEWQAISFFSRRNVLCA